MASAQEREPRSPDRPTSGATASAWIDSPRAWAMYALAAVAYAIAVMQRTSFGVAGVLAMDRFSAGASMVSLFVVVQMLTYAGMQLPVGVLADRFGSRLVVGLGAVLMCVGQLDLAFSTNLAAGITARILVGCGDAMTFTAVLRMLPAWFSRRRIPILNQVTSMLGQGGQLLSSIPLAALLGSPAGRRRSWPPAWRPASRPWRSSSCCGTHRPTPRPPSITRPSPSAGSWPT